MATITYTPNGVPRQPGYYDPKNPYDTGRAGERNSELGGGKNTMSGWDYDAGRARDGARMQSDGVWVGGAGAPAAGGGGGIPGSPVYAQTAAEGLAAYKKALARLNQNRQNTLTQFGYAGDIDPEAGTLKNMRVDSSNPYGLYQNLRRGNAKSYEALRAAAAERRIGSKGLGAQGVSDARHEWGAADASMAQALTGNISGYDAQQQDAWQVYQNLMWQLQLEAARAAAAAAEYGGGWGGDWDPGGSPDDVAAKQQAARVPDQSDVISRLMARGGQTAYTPSAPVVIPKSLAVNPQAKISNAALQRIHAAATARR
jgi:hypothetical protein